MHVQRPDVGSRMHRCCRACTAAVAPVTSVYSVFYSFHDRQTHRNDVLFGSNGTFSDLYLIHCRCKHQFHSVFTLHGIQRSLGNRNLLRISNIYQFTLLHVALPGSPCSPLVGVSAASLFVNKGTLSFPECLELNFL